MIISWKHQLKTVVIMAMMMLSYSILKADPIKDSIVSYINQNFFDTNGTHYEGLSWNWTDTVYTSFERSPEGTAILSRAERLQAETDSLNAVIADAEHKQLSKTYIDSLSKIVSRFEEQQGSIYDLFAAKSAAYVPVMYGYKMEHTFRYKNAGGRMVTMKMYFIFDKTFKITGATIRQ